MTASRTSVDHAVFLNDDRAQEYDPALRQSQHGAVRRRQHPLAGGGGSGTLPEWPSFVGGTSSSQGMSMAQTAVLGDSQGSIPSHSLRFIRDEDNGEEAVGSGLGDDSYVDGGAKGTQPHESLQEGNEEELEGGGVLDMLAEIYAARQPKHMPAI